MKADNAYGTSIVAIAYKQANEIINGRDGAGFRMIVTLDNGKTYDVTPCADDDLSYPEPGHGSVAFWPVENGDNLLIIRQSQIASIEVYEV